MLKPAYTSLAAKVEHSLGVLKAIAKSDSDCDEKFWLA